MSIGSSLNELDGVENPLNHIFSLKFLLIFGGISISCLATPVYKKYNSRKTSMKAISKQYSYLPITSKSVSAAYYV